MLDLPDPGLYRTTQPMPGREDDFPADVLVYLGLSQNGGGKFVVRPAENRRNRWFWREPITALRSPTWAKTLKALPSEGFYTLPESLEFEGGGRWVKNAIVELGYNEKGQPIVFVAEWREEGSENALFFSTRGMMIKDELLGRLLWAPILPVKNEADSTAANRST
jgi:hypothetical protein